MKVRPNKLLQGTDSVHVFVNLPQPKFCASVTLNIVSRVLVSHTEVVATRSSFFNVLTSCRHCVWSRDISNLHIVVGSSSAERSAQVLKVSAIHEHPSYDHRTFDNDIAILELSSPISFGRGAQPIATAAPGSELPAGTLATITGWGALKSGSSSRNQLYAGLVKIVSISDCRRAYPTHAITDNMFCAVGEGVGGCQVDSGGALLVNGVAYGIYSWGYGCDHPDYHGVYTKLSKYHSFISQFIWKGIIS